jgi:hypothetical protein
METEPRHRRAVIAGASIVALTAFAGIALSGIVPGVPLRAGPLQGSGGSGMAPMQAKDTGLLWSLELKNHSGSKIVLDSVKLAENPDQVALLAQPFVWDDPRQVYSAAQAYSIGPLPLPSEWKTPPNLTVNGHVIKSGKRQEPLKINESPPEEQDNTGDNPVVLVELARPSKASTVNGVTVDYHIGWQAFRKTFDMELVVCPPNDLDPCH